MYYFVLKWERRYRWHLKLFGTAAPIAQLRVSALDTTDFIPSRSVVKLPPVYQPGLRR
ncbi:hypothetical protein ACLOJK_006884, partial [Asimina triloba]